MTELDRLLGWWLDRCGPQATSEQRRSFAELLQAEDTELWSWFIGRTEPRRADWKSIVDDVRANYRA